MDHAALYRLRGLIPPNDPRQQDIALLEHQAFAREWTKENPLNALSLLFAVPGYSAAKGLGLIKSRTPASLDEIWAGYRGIQEGLLNRGFNGNP